MTTWRVLFVSFLGGVFTLALLGAVLAATWYLTRMQSEPAADSPAYEPPSDPSAPAEPTWDPGGPAFPAYPADETSEPDSSDGPTTDNLRHRLTFPDDLDPGPNRVRLPDQGTKKTSIAYELAVDSTAIGGNQVAAVTSEQLQSCLSLGDVCDVWVEFWCSYCGNNTFRDKKRLRYDSKAKKSRPLSFEFSPQAGGANDTMAPAGELAGVTLQFLRNNEVFDVVHVCLDVGPREVSGSRCVEGSTKQTQWWRRPDGKRSARTGDASTWSTALRRMTLVQDAAADPPTPYGGVTVRPVNFGRPHPASTPNVTVRISEDKTRGMVTTEIGVNDQVLRTTLADRLQAIGKPDLARRIRASGLAPFYLSADTKFQTTREMQVALENFAYVKLSCAITPDTEFRRFLRRQYDRTSCDPQGNDATLEKMLGVLDWGNTPKAEAATRSLSKIGEFWIENIFPADEQAERESRTLISMLAEIGKARVSATPSAPLKILVDSGADHIPFQLFHLPGQPKDAFFGLIFDIASDGLLTSHPNPSEEVHWPEQRTAQFNAVFGLFTEFEPVTAAGCLGQGVPRKSCEHYKLIATSLQQKFGPGPASPAVRATNFLDKLTNDGPEADLIWFYGHGKTRFDWRKTGGPGTAQYQNQYDGQINRGGRLAFATLPVDNGTIEVARKIDDAVLTMNNIAALEFSGSRGTFLKRRPVVVLIACELGASVLNQDSGGTSGVMATRTFVKLGARGVIATEAEVSSASAKMIGEVLLAEMTDALNGGSGSLALLRTRRKVFATRGSDSNLWPLLFYYAGNHGPYPAR